MTGGGKPPPLLNKGTPLPGGKGTIPPVGSGAATLPLGGGGAHSPRTSQAPNFKQEADQQHIPMGLQYPCPHITTRCLEAIWKTYFDEHYYARGARVANLPGSSTPPKPKLKGEADYHPCANFGSFGSIRAGYGQGSSKRSKSTEGESRRPQGPCRSWDFRSFTDLNSVPSAQAALPHELDHSSLQLMPYNTR